MTHGASGTAGRPRSTANQRYRAAIGVATGVAGVLAAVPATYLAVVSAAALRRRRPGPGGSDGGPAQLIVLVPAHNEEALISRCLATLQSQNYPSHAYRILVVADNCRDSTADVAAAMGVDVLIRHDPAAPGKGRALRWATDRCLVEDAAWDAVVIVDADSVVDDHLLTSLSEHLEAGAEAVQGDYLALVEGGGARGRLRYAAFLLFHRVRFGGRAVLGLPCNLVGNGMLLSRSVLERVPWNAYSGAEDLEYSLNLRFAGVRPVFAPDAHLSAPVAASGPAAHTQRARWEGGRLALVKRRLPDLLRAILGGRRWDLWDAAVDLAVPPLGILSTLVLGGTVAGSGLRGLGVIRTKHFLPWGVAFLAIPVHVFGGLVAGGAPPETYRAIFAAPRLVAAEVRTRSALLRNDRAGEWQRTQRPDEERHR